MNCTLRSIAYCNLCVVLYDFVVIYKLQSAVFRGVRIGTSFIDDSLNVTLIKFAVTRGDCVVLRNTPSSFQRRSMNEICMTLQLMLTAEAVEIV
jgi:hypothetical protein